ncbi:unnamed protein product [Lathyrus sativus]|nr:unnamed protein product [Lathyrus sativus]
MQLMESMDLPKKEVSNYIPNDISFDILSKLPMKSLKRFSCVCKFWSNLFEKPQFMDIYRISLFASKYEDHHNSCFLLKQSLDLSEDNILLLSGETFENKVKLDWPPPFKEYRKRFYIVGSIVNGILCLCRGNGRGDTNYINQEVVLWNPSTEDFKVIPSGSFNHAILKAFPPDTIFEDLPLMFTFVNIYGFCYDPVADDYKLIRNFYFIDSKKFELDLNICPHDETLWQIYSLKSNSWRDIQVKMPNHYYNDEWKQNGNGIYFHGMCHWWGYRDHLKEHMLVSFNLRDEVFIITHSNPNYHVFDRHMFILKDSIATIDYEEPYNIFISVLGEIGVTESWTRLFRIGPLPYSTSPIGVGINGDIFLNRYGEIEKFNLNTNLIEEIGITGRIIRCQMIIYNSSIFPIGGIHS